MTFLVFQMDNCRCFLQNFATVPYPSCTSHILYTVSCSNLWTFSCEKQRHCTSMPDQPAGICIMLLRTFRICAATGNIYVSYHKTLSSSSSSSWSWRVRRVSCSLTFSRLMTYIYIYIYVVPHR
jgi:hypothetical protein